MTSPIKQITHALSNPFDTVSSLLGNAFSKATPNPPGAPALPPPAQSPTAKPVKKGMQQSFLSGVAAAALPGSGGGGAATGKSLLGS